MATQALYLDVRLPQGQQFSHLIPAAHNAFIYVYEGVVTVGDSTTGTTVTAHQAAVLGQGEELIVHSQKDARFLVLAAQPLNEPVVQYGPFVMNTREEIEQAILDYQTGTLVQSKAQAFNE